MALTVRKCLPPTIPLLSANCKLLADRTKLQLLKKPVLEQITTLTALPQDEAVCFHVAAGVDSEVDEVREMLRVVLIDVRASYKGVVKTTEKMADVSAAPASDMLSHDDGELHEYGDVETHAIDPETFDFSPR